MTAAELARELEVSERTIYRDVTALSAAGIPVYADTGRSGGYRLVGGYRTRLTGLSRAEAEALFLSGLQGPAEALRLADTISAAQLKVLAALPPPLRDVSVQVSQRFHLAAPGWFRDAEVPPMLEPLARAIWRDECMRLTYRRYGSERDLIRTAAPYGLVLKAGDWYLVARVREQLRTYRVARIRAIEPTDEAFTRDPTFDLAGFWAQSRAAFVESIFTAEVTLRVRTRSLPRLHRIIEAPAARRGIEAAQPDRPGWVRTVLPVESIEIAHGQLLRLGAEVEVLEPPRLREMMAADSAGMAELYR